MPEKLNRKLKIQNLKMIVEKLTAQMPTMFQTTVKIALKTYMPSLDNLTDEQIDGLISEVRSWCDFVEYGGSYGEC